MRIQIVGDRNILRELEGIMPPSDCDEDTVLNWLVEGSNRVDKHTVYARCAYIIVRRFCHIDDPLHQPTYVDIGKALNLSKERTRFLSVRTLNRLRSLSRRNSIIKSRALKPETRLYVELFGNEDIYELTY